MVGPRCISGLTVLSGALFVVAALGIFASVQLLGLAQASGIWCSVAALVSYAAGAAREGHSPIPAAPAPWAAAAGAACLLAGAAAAVASGRLQQQDEARARLQRRASGVGSSRWRAWAAPELRGGVGSIREDRDAEAAAVAAASASEAVAAAAASAEAGAGGSSGEGNGLEAPLLPPAAAVGEGAAAAAAGAGADEQRRAAFLRAHGAMMAVVAGAVAGVVLLPMDWAPYECRGLPWVPGAAIGILAAAPPVVWLMHLFTTRKADPRPPLQLHPAAAAAPGAAAGAMWVVSAACAVMAVQSLGMRVAVPAASLGLVVAGLWGVLALGELPMLVPQLVFWAGAAASAVGIALLTGLASW